MISRAIEENNIVILTGGVSMGDFDFVPSFLKRAGVNLLFDRINVQPGKPTTFGVHQKAVVFGLPGNPVSSFIQFEVLVRPLMARMTGSDWVPLMQDLPMGVDYERKSTSRMGWIPANVNAASEVIPVDYHGSAHLSSLSYCDGIFAMKPGLKSLKKGETVKLRHL
jgi:molybdopterin molybdotransferase